MNPGTWRQSVTTSALALLTALLLGALLMFSLGQSPWEAYQGLYQGSLGQTQGWAATVRKMVPLVFAGLSVAIAFKAGLFNIGVAGQFLMGTVCAVSVGVNFADAPASWHLAASLTAGIAGGMVWGAIPGLLKVATGAHEVITTIMLNHIAALFARWTVSIGSVARAVPPGPLWDPTALVSAESREILASARIPWLIGPPYRIHYGVLLALLAVLFTWWLLDKTTVGFEIKTVGQKPSAARYAGMRVGWTTVLAMGIAGSMAGMAGAVETLGLHHKFAPGFGGGVGFDGITVALWGQTHPVGIVVASFLLGVLSAGAPRMQFESGVSGDLIRIMQALILIVVAAPQIRDQLLRLPALSRLAGIARGTGPRASR